MKNIKFLGADSTFLTAGKSGKVPPGQINNNGNGNQSVTGEKFQFFYHPDHVGSTSYITDASGEVYQHLEYFPFGETFVEEHSNTNKTPYLFNGKELDEETGLYYYGARYYDPVTSVWLGVDPLADQYSMLSPYNYVANNPINLSDPTGMGPEDETGPTPIEAAMMAKHVYGGESDDILVGGWKPSSRKLPQEVIMNHKKSGFKSALYERELDGKTEYSYVMAGTEDGNDAVTDVTQVIGASKQYDIAADNAKLISQELGKDNVTYVGHSLGGGLAQAAAMATDGTAITFNPAWVSIATKTKKSLWFNSADITNYIVFGEILDQVQTQTGHYVGLYSHGKNRYLASIEVYTPGWGPIQGHFIDSVIEEIKDVKEYNKTRK